MTSPTNVGAVEVDLLANAKGLGESIRREVESAFKGLDFDKLLKDAIGNKPIKIPVQPDFKDLPNKVPTGKPAKVPVEVDPLFDAFKADLKAQTSALAKEIHASIPVDASTDRLRGELGAQLAEIARQLKLPVPTEPGDKAAFQAKLQEQLAELKDRVKLTVPAEADTSDIGPKIRSTRVPPVKVDVDPVLAEFQAEVSQQVRALARSINANIPVGADTSELRAQLGAELAQIEHTMKAEVPTEPGERAVYEAELKAQLEEVSRRVKQTVKVKPEVEKVDLSGLSGLAGKLTPNILGGGLVSGIASGISALGESVSKFAAQAAAGGSQLAGSIAAAAGPISIVVGGLLSAQAAVVALGLAATVLPAVFAAAAGAVASIPAALTGLGAAFATLSLGTKGIADAFKPKAAGGGGGGAGQSAAQQARQVASAARQVEAARRGITAANRAYEASERSLAAAERGVASAQRNLVDAENAVAAAQKKAQQAQAAVNKARAEAVDDLIDMNLQLKDSRLSEQEAAQAVTDALRELNAVKLTGNIPDIEKADLAYQRAQLTLQESTQSTKELSAQTADANKKGVEGSDKVQSALQDQQDALEGVKKAQEGVLDAQNGILDAADSLKSAQDGVASAADGIKSAQDSLASATDSLAQAQTKQAAGAAAVAQQVTKLAPSALAFVGALKALKPAFDDLRLDVQERLFQGLDQTVAHLGDAWIPALKTTLGSYADTFNGFFKNLGAGIGQPQFITDLQTGAEGARQGLQKILDAVTGSLVPAFGTLSAAAGPFLSALGGEIGQIVRDFGNWIEKAKQTGQLQTFFDRATTAIHDIFTTGKLVVTIVGQIIGILIGTSGPKANGKTPLESFNDGLKKISDWLADPTHQQQIADFVKDLQDGFGNFAQAVGEVKGFLDRISGEKGHSHSVGYDIGSSLVSGLLAGLGGAFLSLASSFVGYFLPGGVFIQPILNALGIHSPSTVFMEIGSNIVQGLLDGLGFQPIADRMGQLFGVVTGPLAGAGSWLVNHGQNAVSGMAAGIQRQFPGLSQRAGQIKTTVTNALSNPGAWLSAHGGNTVIGFINGIGARLGQVGTAARNIANYAINALGGLYNNMLSIGSNVVIGIYNGIVSMASWLYNKLISFARAVIPGPIAQALGIASPSKVAAELGAFVSQGLALGITSEGDRVQAAADEIAAKALPQVPDVTLGLGAMADAKLSASLSASAQQQVLLSWAPNATGDQLLKAFQPLINTTYGGSVQRAFTGS